MDDTCSSCFYYRPDNGGECHREPPKVFVFQLVKQAVKEITVMKDRAKFDIDYQTFSAFPAVPPSQWCGHHTKE